MEKLLKQLIQKVEVLIKVQVLTGLRHLNQSEKVMALHGVGVSQKEIADILGASLNTVTSAVAKGTKKSRKKAISSKEG